MAKYLDSTGLTYLWAKIKTWVGNYVKLANGKITIGENEITPLTAHQDVSGKANKSEMAVSTSGDKTTITLKTGTSATVLNAHQDISGKADKSEIPTNTSDLTNDSGFITSSDIPEGAAASTTSPKMDGAAAVGTEMAFARGDHQHPSDTSKVDKTTTVNGHALSGNVSVTKGDVSLGNVTNDAQVKRTEMGAANGVATLDSNGKVPSEQLPSYVDDVIEAYARTGQTALTQNWLATGSASGTVITPEAGKIYVLMADAGDYAANTQFRWGGSVYAPLAGVVSAITNAEIDSITAN